MYVCYKFLRAFLLFDFFSSIADLRNAHPSLGWCGLDHDHQPGRKLLLNMADISPSYSR